MRIGFVGIGSIAKRHINNMYELFKDRKEELIIDLFRSGNGGKLPADIAEKIHMVYQISEPIKEQYDAIFITNPTNMHYHTLLQFKDASNAFFVEKPVFDFYTDDIESLKLSGDKVYYVACPLRYTSVIQYVKENINFDQVYALRAISSSYLPDWRPGVDYRTTYSANKQQGGGVAIDLIHEWDYLTYLIGLPRTVQCLIKKVSPLEIDSDDLAIYIADYNDKTVELHLDYFGRSPIRKLEIFMHDDTIECDLLGSTIHFLKEKKIIDFKQDRNDFQKKELEYFWGIIEGKWQNENTISHACEVLKLTGVKM